MKNKLCSSCGAIFSGDKESCPKCYSVVINRTNNPPTRSNRSNPSDYTTHRVSDFERNIFSLTRWLAGVIAIGVIALIIALLALIIIPLGGAHVSYYDAIADKAKRGDTNTINTIVSSLAGYKPNSSSNIIIPDDVEDFFIKIDRSILSSWINSLPNDQRQDFLDNLSSIIKQGKSANLSDDEFSRLLNNYNNIKRSELLASAITSKFILPIKLGAVCLIGMLIFILCILSLTLVLLAIERNTR